MWDLLEWLTVIILILTCIFLIGGLTYIIVRLVSMIWEAVTELSARIRRDDGEERTKGA